MSRPDSRAPRQPRQVFLFSGHLIDAPDRASPRFPAAREGIAAQAIAEALDQMHAGPDDLALTQGACGGDLLFTEACLARGVTVEWLQPFVEAEFIENSVRRCNSDWESRYHAAHAHLANPPRATPAEHSLATDDPYERCNLWLLDSTLAHGADKARFICLWNGSAGDGLGGTAHMVAEMRQRGGQVVWLDTRQLFA